MLATGQFDQQSEQSLLVELGSGGQQGGQFVAVPSHGGTGAIDRFCCP
ncbi:hypothetical protein N5094_05265 [Shewanella putrefaciens]|nr:hypothetical protein [Shewanella putrefaciens]UXK09638.1 hypothetical protein N5094_05265 [Shewanella putrefaciens]